MSQKQVKIIGLSINQKFGSLKATNLTFDSENRLTVVKGEVGSGKTTFQRALKLGTQGSNTLEDKSLYGDSVDIVTQLLDGEMNVFVGCKSNANGALDYFLYSQDSEGKKIKDPVIDGKKATPAAYLKSLQTALTWNLEQLTSENPTLQRDILLQLYQQELEKKGVYFNKAHPNYVDSIIDKIEKAKEKRNYLDMKRKECGGIADDMSKKGIDFSNRRQVKSVKEIEEQISQTAAKITLAETNVSEARDKKILEIKNKGLEVAAKIKAQSDKIQEHNRKEKQKENAFKTKLEIYNNAVKKTKEYLTPIADPLLDFTVFEENFNKFVEENTIKPKAEEINLLQELQFNDKGTCISKAEDFPADKFEEINSLLVEYKEIAVSYATIMQASPEEIDTSDLVFEKEKLEQKKKRFDEYNSEAIAINSFQDWKEQNEEVKSIQKDYFLKLTEIETGVEGLYICPEYTEDNGEKIAKGNDIYLMYDGSYDPVYFSNPDKEIRKLAAYSDTQKPMICLLIQKYLLSKKEKALPYLWIDQVPIDNKTKVLLDRMSEELGLWLFVNWTGDFDKSELKDGEILIENGEIFEKDEDIK